jgi:hypothetical protein
MPVGINLNEYRKGNAMRVRVGRNRLRRSQIVNKNSQATTRSNQGSGLRQFVRCHAHCVKNIGDASGKKLFGFFQRRHGNPGRARLHLKAHHIHTLARLHMRPKAHAQRIHSSLHVINIRRHPRHINDGSRGVYLGERG